MNIKNNLKRLLVLFVFVFLMIPIVNVIADENVVETIQDAEASIKGTGYTIDTTNKKIILSSGAKVELTGTTEDYNIIVEEYALDVHITLNNYSGEDLSGWNSSHIIELRNGSSVTLTLVGNNYLCSGAEASAIRVPQNTSLVIDGEGSLHAEVENNDCACASAVIGSAYNYSFGNITINSGNIYTHISGGHQTGIGSGRYYDDNFDIEGTITLNGGNIHTQALGSRTNSGKVILAGNGNATVYSDNFLLKDDEFNGIVFSSDGKTGTVKGNATLSQDMEIPEGSVLTVEENASLNIPPDVNVNNNGNIINKGTITNNGTLQNKGKINSTGKITSLTDIDNVEGNNVEIVYYDITIETSDGGGLNSDKVKVKHGENATFNILSDDGYKIKSVIVNGKDMTNDVINGELTLSNITGSININVEFEKIDCDVTITVGNGGTITPDKDFKVKYGENATFNILPDDGYKIKSIVVNDNDMTNDVTNGELTLSNITENIYINVEFEEIDNITINNPETYDNILFYVVLELVSIVGITLIIYFKKYIITK